MCCLERKVWIAQMESNRSVGIALQRVRTNQTQGRCRYNRKLYSIHIYLLLKWQSHRLNFQLIIIYFLIGTFESYSIDWTTFKININNNMHSKVYANTKSNEARPNALRTKTVISRHRNLNCFRIVSNSSSSFIICHAGLVVSSRWEVVQPLVGWWTMCKVVEFIYFYY